MPGPVKQEPKEWHEDTTQTALCESEEKPADELAGDEVETDEWGEVQK